MKFFSSGLIAAAALLAGSFGFGTAYAQGTWQLVTGNCPITSSQGLDAASCTVGTVNATIQAWGNTSTAGSSFVQYDLGANDPNGFGAKQHLGNETGTNNHHAFDNVTTNCGTQASPKNTLCGGTQEFMLLNFGAAKVNLSAISIGYWGSDADMSIYRWDGNTVGTPSGSTLSASWKLVSSKDVNQDSAYSAGATKSFDVKDPNATRPVGSVTDLYSSWWLISTYAGSAVASTGLDSTNNDAFKLQSFTASLCVGTLTGGSTGSSNGQNGNGAGCTPNRTPEPGSLAMAGLALFGVAATRRRLSSRT